MSDITGRIRKLKKLLQKNRDKLLFVTLIYADGSERRLEVDQAFMALNADVVDYRWEECNHVADDNLIGALLADGPFDIEKLFDDGDDSGMLLDKSRRKEV